MRFITTRKSKIRGDLAAGTLAELQTTPLKLASKLCKTHKHWRVGKFYRTCTKCGFTEEKPN